MGDPAPEDQGVFGFFSIAKDFLLQWSPAKIHKQMTKEDLQSINKIISWRDATASSTSFSVGGGGAILGDYTLGATGSAVCTGKPQYRHIQSGASAFDRFFRLFFPGDKKLSGGGI